VFLTKIICVDNSLKKRSTEVPCTLAANKHELAKAFLEKPLFCGYTPKFLCAWPYQISNGGAVIKSLPR
jgi:hypothetical protein